MKEIPLTQDKVALIDDEDFERVNQYKWYAVKAVTGAWYARTIINGDLVYMHQLIMNTTGQLEIDHKDCNGLNNQKFNLRYCTRSQNQMNKNKRKNATSSKFKGVSWDYQHQKWRAEICKDYETYHLGRFVDEIEAAKTYDKAALKLFGEYARPNFVEGGDEND